MFGLIRNIDFLIASIIISIILLVTANRKYKKVSKANKSFTRSLILMILCCIIEILVTVTRTYPQVFAPFLMHIMRSSYSIANGLLAVFVYRYARSYSGSYYVKKNWADITTISVAVLYSLLSIIDIPTGIITWFEEDGTYVHGPLYIVTYAGVGLILLSALIATITDRKYYTKEQFVSINILYALTAVGTVTEIIISSRVLLIMFSITVGLLIVFTSLESPDYVKAVEAKEEAEKARIEADRANSAKSDFLARMSHEIRTPMNAILGMNEMIVKSTKEEQTKVYSSDAYSAARNLLDIINEILDFSRIESGKFSLRNEKYALAPLFRDLWILLCPKAKEEGLDLEFDIDPNLNAEHFGDRIRIRQILINLLNNAIKYTDEGKITLRVTCLDDNIMGATGKCDKIRYEIIDTGRGIKEEDREKLFEAFSRIEEHRSMTITGTGLGLNITAALLELMDSKLEVESEYEKGSDFSFILCQKVESDTKIGQYDTSKIEESAVSDSTVKEDVAGKKVLCVDDTPLNLKVFRAFLKDSGLEIDLAESAKDALLLTKQTKYDLIFMDHLMPEIDGVECFRMIKEQEGGLNHETPEIVITANAIKGAMEKYSEIGFIDTCFKPYSKYTLSNVINKYLV